uniref:Uncharacterized protein n=1 Tax=Palpitomonas bilix TaxID=652834 RepID=A0A7S3GAQ4_9EUKA|mmetsp:Transcript_33753/g.86559  ORF Transcript_33753/g.86559 Transcript_33753/m.86559 type:complete len:177 (+) Transcript_33753:141-671(+)
MIKDRGKSESSLAAFRTSNASCLPVGQPFFSSSYSGLDSIINKYSKQAYSLVASLENLNYYTRSFDAENTIRLDSSIHDFLWQIGREDLKEGLAQSKQLLVSDLQQYWSVETKLSGLGFSFLVLAVLVMYLENAATFLEKDGAREPPSCSDESEGEKCSWIHGNPGTGLPTRIWGP